MNFQEQLKYDKFQRVQERLHSRWVQAGTKAIIQTTQMSVTNTIETKLEAKEIIRDTIQTDVEKWRVTTPQAKQPVVNNTIKTKQEVREMVLGVVELDVANHGAPPENSGIAVYRYGMKLPYSYCVKPLAREDKNWNWLYNYYGALRLADVLGRTLPNIEQLGAAINANPKSFCQSKDQYFSILSPDRAVASLERGSMVVCKVYWWSNRISVRFLVD